MYRLNLTEMFKEDLQSSVNYIRHTLNAPLAAQNLKYDTKETYKRIKERPFSYPAVPDDYLAASGFRFAMVKNYIIFYIVDEKTINIIRFLYGRRDWKNILM